MVAAPSGRRSPSSGRGEGAPGPEDAAAATGAAEPGLAGTPRRSEGLTPDDVGNLNAVLEHEIAHNTVKNYGIQWRIFNGWALSKGVAALPADAAQVAAYLAERIEQHGHKPATLRVAAAAIAFVHRTAGLDDPCARAEVKRTLKGATRKTGRSQKQAAALTAEALARIQSTARRPRPGRGGSLERPQTAQSRGNLDIALISLMRDAMLRISEAAALTWTDIPTEPDGTGRLLIRRSKTDPQGQGVVAFVSAPTMAALERRRTLPPTRRSRPLCSSQEVPPHVARMTVVVNSILPCQEAFPVDAPHPETSPRRWIQAKGLGECAVGAPSTQRASADADAVKHVGNAQHGFGGHSR